MLLLNYGGTKSVAPILCAAYFLGLYACEATSKVEKRGKEAHTVDTEVTASVQKVSHKCPSDMKHVSGLYCPQVEQRCLRWLDVNQSPSANSGIGPMRCAEFALSKCLSKQRKEEDVCVDEFEWPNKENEFPTLAKSWHDSKAQCESIGKRLCTAEEWTFACEGEQMKPYPYGDGLHRDAVACNIDQPSMDPSTPRSEWPKHNLSEPSGVRPNCVSPFGVRDMTGNVDEFVFNVGGSYTKAPFVSGLKGGYWGPVRTRCRPMTDVHGPDFSFYQIGWRCCKDVTK